VLYYRQGDYHNAIKEIKRSIAIVNENRNKPSINLRHLVRNYYILSHCYGELKRISEKMVAIDSCVSLSVKLNSSDEFALYVLQERVENLFDAGDYKRTYDFAVLGETIAKQSAIKESKEFTNFFSGWVVNTLIALKRFKPAGIILLEKIEECKRHHTTQYLSTFYEQLAQVQVETGNIDEARNTFQLAYQYGLRMGETLKCSQILNNLGYYIHFKQYNDFDAAINVYRKALQHLDAKKNPTAVEIFESLNIYGNIAYVFVQQGKYDSAFRNFQKAFDQIRPGISEREILQTTWIDSSYKKIRYLVSLMIEKGEAYTKRHKETKESKDIQEAIRIYKITDLVLDKIKAGQSEIQSKLFWRSDTRNLYEHAIEACYLAGNPGDAFYFFEKSRAVLLNDQLNEHQLLKEDDMLQLAQVKRKILQLEREHNDTGDVPGRAEIGKELFFNKQELDRLINTIKINNPLYYQSFFDSASITIPDVRKNILKDHQALVELFAGDSAVYVLVVTKKDIYFKRIKKDSFRDLANSYISYISNSSLQNRHFPEFVNISSNLYHLVFRDIAIPPGRIIISPDGRYFPFESLITKEQPLTYFLNDYAVSYTYSARYLMNRFVNTSASAPKNFIGIAPIEYPAGMHLASLPGSDRSLQKLQSYFGNTDNFIAAAASRSNFLNQYHKYRIIQLYTHSSDSSVQDEPVIYFADSVLYLSDLISGAKPVTSLIVLSACETGTGKVYNGEGVFSFNRGFAALGIPAAITNLWSVDNTSTYLLTELFYKWLAEGLPSDVALQKAKLEFLREGSKEKSMPYYWAGPVLVGKTDAIELSKPYPWKWIVLLACIGAVIFFALRKWKILKTMA
jgi:CHAT domain-containing protein/Tfp pilus assembly protein PilF